MQVINALNPGQGTRLTFEEDRHNALKEQVEKDKVFQRRVQVISVICMSLLLAAGVTGFVLALTIVPYCLFFTLLLGGATATTTLSCIGLCATTLDETKGLLTNKPLCSKLLRTISYSGNQPVYIRDEKSWKYLLDFYQHYRQKVAVKVTEELNPVLTGNDVDPMTNLMLGYLLPEDESPQPEIL